jgi:carbamoylphosphate synthase large subunit
MTGALRFADKVGYPVLVRPSYVLSGRIREYIHMYICIYIYE